MQRGLKPYEPTTILVRTMKKRLVKTGNSLAVVLDRTTLEQTGIGPETDLEISTDGDVVVISPLRDAERSRKLRATLEDAHERFSGVFKRLAE